MSALIRFINSIVYNGLESLGRYYSVYRAVVVNVNDPENLHRVKLIIPQITGDKAFNYWAFPRNVFSGEGYGSQVLPQKGDMVWVEFEGGHPEVPIWSHGHFSRKEKPSNKDKELDDVNCYWFVTPKGNKVKLNDTKNTIYVENSIGHSILMDENLIRVKTRKGKYLELNDQAVSVISDNISLGKLNTSKYKSVLGEELKDILSELIQILQDATVLTQLGPQQFMPPFQIKFALLKQKLSKFLSKVNTLE